MDEERTQERLLDPGRVFVISGPSGVGKNSIAAELRRRGRAVRGVTATTRPARTGEVDGRDYHFVSETQFRRWLEQGRLLEHTRYLGHYYGTPVAALNEAVRSGLPVVLTIDVDGGLQIKRKWPEVTLIFVQPPSDEELARRLRTRARDEAASIEQRLRRAREELAYADQYDYCVVNDRIEDAADQVAQIMAERSAPEGNRS